MPSPAPVSNVRVSMFARVLVLASATTMAAFAGTITVDETMRGAFGTLNQNNTNGCSSVKDGNQACGPTAATNSFTFLQNAYGYIYGNNLIDTSPANTANMLSGANYMMCQACNGGTRIDNFVSGKMNWIENHLPGKTVYEVQTVFPALKIPGDQGPPTFAFLLAQLQAGEDTELFVSYHDANGYQIPGMPGKFYGGHYVTMTGLVWNDANSNGMLDAGDTLTLNFIDPATGAAGSATGSLDAFGFDTNYGAGGAVTGASISGIVSESPVPEPATYLIMTAGLIGLALVRRRST
jgi:hypothetical protein